MMLDDMLALLPDNDTGQIDAADLRAVVTGLYQLAASALLVGYKWDRTEPPGQQQAAITPDWSTAGTTMLFSKVVAGATSPSWDQIAGVLATGHYLRLRQNSDRSIFLVARIEGPHVDAGSYSTLPVTIVEIGGAEPSNGTDMTLDIEFQWTAP